MISFTHGVPLKSAVDSVSAKTPLGTALRTDGLSRLPVQLRQRAFFSAAVEETRLLERMKRDILTRLRLERRVLADGSQGTFQRRDQFVREMRMMAESYGLRPTDGTRGSLTDIGSTRRLNLIWDTQIKMAQGYSEWKMGQDKDVLRAVPAQELIRGAQRMMPRDWQSRWLEAMRDIKTSAVLTDAGRMVALKNDPIWAHLSRFDQPWTPLDFNSGMIFRNVRRKDAIRMGLIKKGEEVEPMDTDFNGGLSASMAGISTGGKKGLKDHFGDMVEINEERNVIEWRGDRLDALVDRAERRVNGETFDKKLKAISFGKVNHDLVTKTKSIMDIEGFELKPMEDDFYHILKRHGKNGKSRNDARPITADDFYYLMTTWRTPTKIEAGNRPRTLEFTYDFFGQLLSVLWLRSPQQKVLNLRTMYIKNELGSHGRSPST